ncbi:MAG: ribonuclease D [bacterium]|nr:ribonuclease D [bacterium]
MAKNPVIHLHKGDLPDDVVFTDSVAIDTETMGLDHRHNRLCLVQLSAGDGTCHLLQIQKGIPSPNLLRLLEDQNIEKLFHFARFDVAVLYRHFGTRCTPLFCTKIASKLSRTYTDRHSLKELCRHLLKVEISKQEQTSDWGAETLTQAQQLYAATDVLHLHALKENLEKLVKREERTHIAKAAFDFLPIRAELDLLGFEDPDLFRH